MSRRGYRTSSTIFCSPSRWTLLRSKYRRAVAFRIHRESVSIVFIKKKMLVAVVGAGVIGMTSALAVKDAFPQFVVHVFADQFSPDTTGDGSAGLWSPYLLGNTPSNKIQAWAGATLRWLERLWKMGFASELGLSLVPVYRVTSDQKAPLPVSSWMELVYGAHRLSANQLEKMNMERGANYTDGWMFVTYTSEPTRFLPWLTKQFTAAGGKLWKRKVHDLRELIDEGYDLIINCTGLGVRELIGDNTVIPIRGQVARVTASWVMHGFLEDDEHGNYIIPNLDNVVLGGTHQENDYDCTPRREDFELIHAGCCRILPSLKAAQVTKQWVGLRPGKSEIRLEAEVFQSSNGRDVTVIHNYGHGGSGVTLCWGCALDVAKIVQNAKGLKSNL